MEKLRIYTVKKYIVKEDAQEKKERERRKEERISLLKSKYHSVGIYSKKRQKALSCLLYRFKKCNPYYNMLVEIYLKDYSREDFFNMCYMVAFENDPEDFKTMYMELQKQIETETSVTRKAKAKQVYKPLSIEVLRDMGNEPSETSTMRAIENKIDMELLTTYISNTLTSTQVKALAEYLNDGKKIDSRQKRRIKAKLNNMDFKLLLY